MREDAFRAFLTAANYTANSIASRLSRCRAVERHLRVDLDETAFDGTTIEAFRTALGRAGCGGAVLANQLNAVRTYGRFREASGHPPPTAAPRSAAPAAPPPSPRDPTLAAASVPDLMRRYAAILAELRHRGVLRTGNGPIGDYAEALFAEALGWKLAGNSTLGYDAVDSGGVRYQIKARRITPRNPSRQLGALRRLPDRGFDILAAVLFDETVAIIRAALIPYEIVHCLAKHVEHTNSWRFMLSDGVWTLPGVQDATEMLRSTGMTQRTEKG